MTYFLLIRVICVICGICGLYHILRIALSLLALNVEPHVPMRVGIPSNQSLIQHGVDHLHKPDNIPRRNCACGIWKSKGVLNPYGIISISDGCLFLQPA